ncbi:hypothetical protein [Sediminispirochaeta bajacaliforniensis]|uniref:hypothetical protein n=1 Tax=Sediminispirochaeta bajacaliforniensis TaxID=148 RepID=UPI00036E45F5|nr:hypothetical protein [Sediminispirochaeta bajacaliforniensis]
MSKASELVSALFFLCIILSFSSCSAYSPEIASLFWRLEISVPDGGAYTEGLRLFVLADDRDGIEDVGSLRLDCTERELSWTVEEDELIIIDRNGEAWYGYPRFEMPNEDSFPRASYEVTLIDKGGRESSVRFTIDDSISFDDAFLPFRSETDALALVLPGEPTNWLATEFRLYNEMGDSVLSEKAAVGDDGILHLPKKLLARGKGKDAPRWRAYAYDRSSGIAVLFGPCDLSQEEGAQ